jgi:predicted Ser/Thr protein kinase
MELEMKNTLPVISGVTVTIKLGGGNFGEVFKGEWKGTFVALKKLKSSASQDFEEFAKESTMLL